MGLFTKLLEIDKSENRIANLERGLTPILEPEFSSDCVLLVSLINRK